MASKRVLGIGLDPHTIDFNGDFLRGKSLTVESIIAGTNAETARLRSMGYDFDWLLLDARGTPEAAAEAAKIELASRPVEVVIIGGGIRLDPARTPMLEALVNAVGQAAHGAKLAFNTSPTETVQAIERVARTNPG